MRAVLLSPNDPAWPQLVAGLPADIYYLPGYAIVCARQVQGEPLLFAASERERLWVLALIVRPVPPALVEGRPLFDAASPYGYSGPLVRAGDGVLESWCARAIGALRAELKERDIVALFARLHPLRPHPLAPLADAGMLVHHGDTVVVDLTRSSEELWRATRSRFRTDIQALCRRGFSASMDQSCARLADFQDLYYQTMKRVGATQEYFLSSDYYTTLQENLNGHLHLCSVESDGRLACGGLFTEMDGIVQYHLGGTHDEFLLFSPSKLMFHFVRSWAKERGNAILHIGGGHGGAADNLFHFKRGFSSQTVPFRTWRLVADVDAYERLNGRWRALGGDDWVERSDDYFPAYRRPLPSP